MFIKEDYQGKKTLTNITKTLSASLALIAIIAGGVLYFENTYFHVADAKELEAHIEDQTIRTFEKQSKLLDMRYLEQLQCQEQLVKKELERDPLDTLLEDKLRRIKNIIEKLEDKLYK